MQFTAQHARAILGGRKTQARIPVQEARTIRRKNGTTYNSKPYQPRIGQTITFNITRPDEIIPVRLTVTAHHTQRLGDITFPDVLAEGHKTTDDFKTWWVAIHDKPWHALKPDPAGWLHHPYGTARSNKQLEQHEAVIAGPIHRFDQRHANTPVYAITFELDKTQHDRYLALTGHGDTLGYTTNPSHAIDDRDSHLQPLTALSEQDLKIIVADARRADDELRQNTAIQARRTMERELEKLADGIVDQRVHDRIRLIRRNLKAIDTILKTAA